MNKQAAAAAVITREAFELYRESPENIFLSAALIKTAAAIEGGYSVKESVNAYFPEGDRERVIASLEKTAATFAIPSWRELKAAYSPKNLLQSLGISAGGAIGGGLVGATSRGKTPGPLPVRIAGGAVGGVLGAAPLNINRPIGQVPPARDIPRTMLDWK